MGTIDGGQANDHRQHHLHHQTLIIETWECSTWHDCWRATSDTVWQLKMDALDFSFRSISTCFPAESGSERYETENGRI